MLLLGQSLCQKQLEPVLGSTLWSQDRLTDIQKLSVALSVKSTVMDGSSYPRQSTRRVVLPREYLWIDPATPAS